MTPREFGVGMCAGMTLIAFLAAIASCAFGMWSEALYYVAGAGFSLFLLCWMAGAHQRRALRENP